MKRVGWRFKGRTSVGGRSRRGRTLPLRIWLIVAVAAVISAGFLAQVGLTAVMKAWDQQAEIARLAEIRHILGTTPDAWYTRGWQHHAVSSLDSLGVDVALYRIPATRVDDQMPVASPVFDTAGARAYLAADGVENDGTSTVFQRLVLGSDNAPAGLALLWLTEPAPGELPQVLWPVVELGAFAFTLAIVVWLVGLPVLRPLAELSRAAENMAGGDLDVRLSSASPVREIAEVSSALVGTGKALRDSLDKQAILEEDRRLFVAAVAHDLRTPLFMLRGYLKGLERGVAATPEKITHYLASCTAQADVLERRISDLFAFARLEYLDQQPERTLLEVGDLLDKTVEAARPLAAGKRIFLKLVGPEYPCFVLGDRHLLVLVVENLLDNALRHTPVGGSVTVRWRRSGGTVEFMVEDTGPGIDGQDMPHLFTPRYRGDASRDHDSDGAGLGLSIARRILRVHGGDLAAANAASGGAIFTATLRAEE